MLPCVCLVIDHRRCQNVVRTSVTHSPIASCATFLFFPHFDVICDLLLDRRTATHNLFVKLNSVRHGTYHLFYNITLRHRNKTSLLIELYHKKCSCSLLRQEKRSPRKFIHDNRLHTSNSIKFIHKDGLSVSSSDNCEDSSAFLAEGTSAITFEIISVKMFAL